MVAKGEGAVREIPASILKKARDYAFPGDDENIIASIASAILAERARCKKIAILRSGRAATELAAAKTEAEKLFYRGCERASEAIATEIGLA